MKRYYCLLLVLIGLNACREGSPMGPDIDRIFGEFAIVNEFNISQKTVDFANSESIVFTAQFEAYEDWTLRITGLTSNSYKEFTGTGDVIDINWKGESSAIPVLRAEECLVQFSVAGESYFVEDTVEIISVKVNEGVLVADFENGLPASFPRFFQSGVNFFADPTNAAEGNQYLNCGGIVPWDYLIGRVEFPALNAVGQTYFPLNPNQHEVFFNVMVGGDASLPESFMIWFFKEDDNGDGVWDASSEDMWITGNLPIDHDGWELYSTAYDSLTIATEGDGSNGNGQRQPERLLSADFLLLIDPAKGECRGNLDYIIFTEGGPLKP